MSLLKLILLAGMAFLVGWFCARSGGSNHPSPEVTKATTTVNKAVIMPRVMRFCEK